MRRVLFAGAAAFSIYAPNTAVAMGGGWTPPSASPYAILEPQTVNPNYAPPPPPGETGVSAEEKKRSPHRVRHPSRRP
jgi:hypothetical protein